MTKTIVVVYKKPRGRKTYIKVINGTTVDDLLSTKKRKPPLPHDYELIDIGWGDSFLETFKEQYKVKNTDINGGEWNQNNY